METIIIDAYNLMHKVPELKSLLKKDRSVFSEALIAKMQSHFYRRKAEVILVFDGHGQNKHSGNITLKFSKTDVGNSYHSADEMIKEMIEKKRNKKLLKIVSSDNEINWFARECGCVVQDSGSFWEDVKQRRRKLKTAYLESHEKPQELSKGEFEYLLKQFKKK